MDALDQWLDAPDELDAYLDAPDSPARPASIPPLRNAASYTPPPPAIDDRTPVGAVEFMGRQGLSGFLNAPRAAAIVAGGSPNPVDMLMQAAGREPRLQNALFEGAKKLGEIQQERYDLQPNERASPLVQFLGGAANLAGSLPAMIATGGALAPELGAPTLLGRLLQGFTTAAPTVGIPSGVNRAADVVEQGGTTGQAEGALALNSALMSAMGAVPMAPAAGSFLKKLAVAAPVGAGLGAVVGPAQRAGENAILNRHDAVENPQLALQDAGLGALMAPLAAAHGARPAAEASPAAAVPPLPRAAPAPAPSAPAGAPALLQALRAAATQAAPPEPTLGRIPAAVAGNRGPQPGADLGGSPAAAPSPPIERPGAPPAGPPVGRGGPAPVVGNAKPEPAPALSGRTDSVLVGKDYQPVQYRVMEAGDLSATMGKAENQYRDRGRAASQQQVATIANAPDYRQVAASPVMDFGAPVLSADGRIIAGNGRAAGVARAYEQGSATGYRAALEADAPNLGVDPAAVKAMQRPVLVRVLQPGVDVGKAAVLSNEGGALRMSALEQAKVDAERLGDIGELQTGDNGELNIPANRDFVQRLLRQTPQNQHGALVDAQGRLSQEGAQRMRNAVLFKAYGDSDTLGRLVESTDQGARNLATALLRAAPRWAAARDKMASGQLFERDPTPHILAAVDLLSELRGKGDTTRDYRMQGDLVGRDIPPEAIDVASFFERNMRSAPKMQALFDGFLDELETYGSPAEGDGLFGPRPAPPDVGKMLRGPETSQPEGQGGSGGTGQDAGAGVEAAGGGRAAGRFSAQAAPGEDVTAAPPAPGDRFIVYRLQKPGVDTLAGTNAGNAVGVADYATRVDDQESAVGAEGSGTAIAKYEVTVDAPFGEYRALRGGVGAAEAGVGRKFVGGMAVYSFGRSGFTARKIGEIPLDKARAVLRTTAGSGHFDTVGALAGGDAIREAFDASRVPLTEQRGRLRNMLTRALKANPQFQGRLARAARALGLPTVAGPVKSESRAWRKIEADYAGDASQIRDLMRATVLVHDPAEAGRVVAAIQREFGTNGPPPRSSFGTNTPDGYHDAKVYAVLDGVTGEIQVNDPWTVLLKEHPQIHDQAYAGRQEIDKIAGERDLTAEEKARRDALNEFMAEFYQQATQLRAALPFDEAVKAAQAAVARTGRFDYERYLPDAPTLEDFLARADSTNASNSSVDSRVASPTQGSEPMRRGGSVSNASTAHVPAGDGTKAIGRPSLSHSSESAGSPRDLGMADTSNASLPHNRMEQPLLEAHTEQDVADRARAARARAEQDAAAQRKAEADAQRGDFKLTGSNREADQATAAGQRSLFLRGPAPRDATGVSGDVRVAKIRAALMDRVGRRTINRLEQAGKLKIVRTQDELPEQPPDGARAKGYFDGEHAWIVGENVAPHEAMGVFLHEVGEHAGLREMLGDEGYADLADQFQRLHDDGDPLAIAAEDAVPDFVAEADRDSERLAYMIEGAANADNASPAALRFVRDAVARIRAWVYSRPWIKNLGFRLALTPRDIAALARRAADYLAEGNGIETSSTRGAQEDRLFSGKADHTWEVIDGQTGARVGTYKSGVSARQAVDRLDNKHGGYRYRARPIAGYQNNPALNAELAAREQARGAQEDRLFSGKADHTWEVIDGQTGARVGTYKSGVSARQAVDRLDNKHGGYRYRARPIAGYQNNPALNAELAAREQARGAQEGKFSTGAPEQKRELPRIPAMQKVFDRGADFAKAILGGEHMVFGEGADRISFKLADNAPDSFKQLLREYRVANTKAQGTVVSALKAGKELTPEHRALISDVVEKEVQQGVSTPEDIVHLAGAMETALQAQSDELVRLGMLSKDTRDRWAGKYLPRFYQRPETTKEFDTFHKGFMSGIAGRNLKARGIFDVIDRAELPSKEKLGWQLRGDLQQALNIPDDSGKVTIWRDFTREERTRMGEIRDGVFRFAQGYLNVSRDIALGRLFEATAKNGDVASTLPKPGWVQVPDTQVPGTGGVRKYGALSGLYLHPDAFEHIQHFARSGNALERAYLRVLSAWKEGKTSWNPVAHGNNTVSNVVMASFAGIHPWDAMAYAKAAAEYKRKGTLYQEAVEHGLIGSEFYGNEIADLMPEITNQMPIDVIAGNWFTRKAAMAMRYSGLAKYRELMGKLYQAEDQYFKLLTYMDRRGRGYTPNEATADAERYFFDYSDLPAGARKLRNTILPFWSYTYKAAPAVLHTMMTRPWVPAMWIGALAGANWWAYESLFGAQAENREDYERANLPPYLMGHTALGTPKLIRLPTNGPQGQALFLDIYRRVPLGDLFDVTNNTGGLPLPAPLTPSNPMLTSLNALVFNTDTFSGEKIVGDSDDAWSAAGKRSKYLLDQWLPNTPLMPGSYSWTKLMQGVSAETGPIEIPGVASYAGKDYHGNEASLPRAAADVLTGTKVRSVDVEFEHGKRMRELRFQLGELDKEEKRSLRDQSQTASARTDARQGFDRRRQAIIEKVHELERHQ